jgi:hypothetical protein
MLMYQTTMLCMLEPNFQNLTYGLGSINIIRLRDNKLTSPTLPAGQTPSNLAISADGKILFVNYVMNTVNAISLHNNK